MFKQCLLVPLKRAGTWLHSSLLPRRLIFPLTACGQCTQHNRIHYQYNFLSDVKLIMNFFKSCCPAHHACVKPSAFARPNKQTVTLVTHCQTTGLHSTRYKYDDKQATWY